MRDPNSAISMVYKDEPLTIIQMDEVPEYTTEDYDLSDEKDFVKYLNTIEKIIRGSFEYRSMINYLRTYLDMNKCSFYENVNNIDTSKIKIHIHHEPFTLYDICLIVFNKRKTYNESLADEMIAKEVMYLHYNLLVGLIPLAETPHELVHNQYLFVPTTHVLGKYKEFVELYKTFITEEQLDILDKIETATVEYEGADKGVLNSNFIYLDLTGAYKLPKLEDVVNSMRDRVKEIKEARNR